MVILNRRGTSQDISRIDSFRCIKAKKFPLVNSNRLTIRFRKEVKLHMDITIPAMKMILPDQIVINLISSSLVLIQAKVS